MPPPEKPGTGRGRPRGPKKNPKPQPQPLKKPPNDPKLKTGPELKKPNPERKMGPPELKEPMPVKVKPVPESEPERDGGSGVPFLNPQPAFSCTTLRICPPPPAPPATVHLRSTRLPTPLIALSASLLAVSAVLLLALLVRWLDHGDEESVLDAEDVAMMAQAVGEEEEEEEEVNDDGVHHLWYIRTKGLDERAIAAIAAVVYDAGTKRAGASDGGCAVCLAEFRDGETLRLLPRCAHAFHRGCIDPWLRAHVNCPLCRAPVQVASNSNSKGPTTATAAAASLPRADESVATHLGGGARRTGEEDSAERRAPHSSDRAVRRAVSMVALPRRGDVSVQLQAPPAAASQSGREEDLTGLAKIRRLLKLSEALDVAGIVAGAAGRSVSFGAGRSCQRVPPRSSGPSSTAAGINGEEIG